MIRKAVEPVTKIFPKCRSCVLFRYNFGDSYCEHKGYWFRARHIDSGEEVVRKLITYHEIAYCRKREEVAPQMKLFGR